MRTLKITHYLNKKLKPYSDREGNYYPVYVRILLGSEVHRIKSPTFDTGIKWEDYQSDESFKLQEIQDKIACESNLLKYAYTNSLVFEKYNLNDIIKGLSVNLIDNNLQNTLDPYGFFEIMLDSLASLLYDKTGISKMYFLENIKIHNLRDYKYLISNIEFKNTDTNFIFNLIILFIKFEIDHFTPAKPLNCYEWYYNNAKEKFLIECKDIDQQNRIFKWVIGNIDRWCKINIFKK